MQTEIKATLKDTTGRATCEMVLHLEPGMTDTSFPKASIRIRTAGGKEISVPLHVFHKETADLCLKAYDMRRVVRFPGLNAV